MEKQFVDYFQRLTGASYQLLDSVGLPREVIPFKQLQPDLSFKLDHLKGSAIANYQDLKRPQPNGCEVRADLGVGLNSIGMLSDRLSTLIIKEWCLRNKPSSNLAKADELYQTQTMDVIYALARAQPGNSSMNTKITYYRSDVTASSWEEAFYGLLSTNILNWESQEVLYIKDIKLLPCEELRDYISWFSFGNIQRNEYIQYCEELYWQWK
jgi:hypothetical protein